VHFEISRVAPNKGTIALFAVVVVAAIFSVAYSFFPLIFIFSFFAHRCNFPEHNVMRQAEKAPQQAMRCLAMRGEGAVVVAEDAQ